MQRMAHGVNSSDRASEISTALTTEPEVPTVPFSFMFPALSDDANKLLTPSEKTLGDLADLGATMEDKDDNTDFDSTIPAAYTYFAQFVDHDIAFTDVHKKEGQTDSELLNDKNLSPWSKTDIADKVRNKRIVPLGLECVYGNLTNRQLPPRDGEKFALGRVCPHHNRIIYKDEDNDLVRTGHSPDFKKDRAALINDPRNDSNLIVSQFHVAFLRAHNEIVDKLKCTFEDARLILLKHYQWMIYHDLLPRFVRKEEIEAARYDPFEEPPAGVPLEFSIAAYRFGHSMIRRSYYLNDSFPRISLNRLFMLTVLSNGLTATPGEGCLNLPGNKIIQWRKFFEGGRNKARQIRPQMVEPLFTLRDEASQHVKGEKRLAVQDLKRGYMMRIPTGQALAGRIGIKKEEELTADDFQKYAVNSKQFDVLKTSEFLTKTPLWFYVLTEAAKQHHVTRKDQLGPVGGRIVAEAIVEFIRRTPDSFLNNGWTPSDLCFKPGKFLITDLLRRAGVLENP